MQPANLNPCLCPALSVLSPHCPPPKTNTHTGDIQEALDSAAAASQSHAAAAADADGLRRQLAALQQQFDAERRQAGEAQAQAARLHEQVRCVHTCMCDDLGGVRSRQNAAAMLLVIDMSDLSPQHTVPLLIHSACCVLPACLHTLSTCLHCAPTAEAAAGGCRGCCCCGCAAGVQSA